MRFDRRQECQTSAVAARRASRNHRVAGVARCDNAKNKVVITLADAAEVWFTPNAAESRKGAIVASAILARLPQQSVFLPIRSDSDRRRKEALRGSQGLCDRTNHQTTISGVGDSACHSSPVKSHRTRPPSRQEIPPPLV